MRSPWRRSLARTLALALVLAGAAPGRPAAWAAARTQDQRALPLVPARAVAQAGEAEQDAAEDEEAPEVGSTAYKAVQRVRELQHLRVDLLLRDLRRAHPLDEEVAETARAALHAAAEAFLDERPPRYVPGDAWGQSPAYVSMEPFATLLDSERWRAALEATLSAEARGVLSARREERAARVRGTLIAYVGERLRHAWGLTDAELSDLGEPLGRLADGVIEDGVVQPFDPYAYFFFFREGEPLSAEVRAAGIVDALPAPRRELAEETLRRGRTQWHDYAFEAEFLLSTGDAGAAERARRLLRGYARAKLQRAGAVPGDARLALAPATTPRDDEFFVALARDVLGLAAEVELPVSPLAGQDALRAAWADYLLAVLDARALFSDEQRADLAPLMREYADARMDRYRGMDLGALQLPSDLDVPREDAYVPSPVRQGELDVKLKSVRDTLHSFCDEAQREVLGA